MKFYLSSHRLGNQTELLKGLNWPFSNPDLKKIKSHIVRDMDDHKESDGIKREIEYCKKNNLPYKTVADGEVIIIK